MAPNVEPTFFKFMEPSVRKVSVGKPLEDSLLPALNFIMMYRSLRLHAFSLGVLKPNFAISPCRVIFYPFVIVYIYQESWALLSEVEGWALWGLSSIFEPEEGQEAQSSHFMSIWGRRASIEGAICRGSSLLIAALWSWVLRPSANGWVFLIVFYVIFSFSLRVFLRSIRRKHILAVLISQRPFLYSFLVVWHFSLFEEVVVISVFIQNASICQTWQ